MQPYDIYIYIFIWKVASIISRHLLETPGYGVPLESNDLILEWARTPHIRLMLVYKGCKVSSDEKQGVSFK